MTTDFLPFTRPSIDEATIASVANVLRSGSRKAAAVTLLFDALKGWFPVFAVGHWGDAYGLGPGTAAMSSAARRASSASRLVLTVLTRRSSGAG